MSENVTNWRDAWDPLTPRGVAAFAGGSFVRLWLTQLLIAIIATAAMGIFLRTEWFPVIRSSIDAMPAEGEIVNGQLNWQGEREIELAENRFLGVGVDLFHNGELSHSADLELEFGQGDLHVFLPLLGCQVVRYPGGEGMPFNQAELEPWWGAWQPWILAIAMLGMVIGLLVSWQALATFYCLAVWIVSFIAKRKLTLAQSWRLAGAAMMPGALFLTAGIVAYNLHGIDLMRFGAVYALHFVIGLVYVVIAPWFCPRVTVKKTPEVRSEENPFAKVETRDVNARPKSARAPENPFQQSPGEVDK